jgi:ferritin-like metal-binding protein YciE
MSLKNLDDLFEEQIQDIYSAETQLQKASSNMIKEITDSELKKAFERYMNETKSKLDRISKVANTCELELKGEACEAMKGLLKESEKITKENISDEVLDAASIASLQRIIHYKIAAYGTAATYAQMLDAPDCAKLLRETVSDEKKCDESLTKLAESRINQMAMSA